VLISTESRQLSHVSKFSKQARLYSVVDGVMLDHRFATDLKTLHFSDDSSKNSVGGCNWPGLACGYVTSNSKKFCQCIHIDNCPSSCKHDNDSY